MSQTAVINNKKLTFYLNPVTGCPELLFHALCNTHAQGRLIEGTNLDTLDLLQTQKNSFETWLIESQHGISSLLSLVETDRLSNELLLEVAQAMAGLSEIQGLLSELQTSIISTKERLRMENATLSVLDALNSKEPTKIT